LISSYYPRLCGIATFCEEAREFIKKANPDRDVLIISHKDGEGKGVFPIIDITNRFWWKPVAEKIKELSPYVVHIEHEYGLYEYVDERGIGDRNEGFIELLGAISEYPIVVEPHTIHGRLREFEENFVYQLCKYSDIVLFKSDYQKWRLEWTFSQKNWKIPTNIMVVPHGARPDRYWSEDEVSRLKEELGLTKLPYLSQNLVGLVGWIQSNKRWDILTSMWEEIVKEIEKRSGQAWDLLAAGAYRDPRHYNEYKKYREEVELLERKGFAHYYEFIPRGELYYKVMAVCDFVVLPTVDETQSGTLARIIALNKPFITTAPVEGLTAQALESGGGLLFTNKEMLKEHVIELACNENLRKKLSENLRRYLKEVVSWEIVAQKYNKAYEYARRKKIERREVIIPPEF
ncbi:MAG: glycosyltransferase, partial [Actinobacteria bacterium]|nr:glycosyltransferase [Actinomycetota bacterium]